MAVEREGENLDMEKVDLEQIGTILARPSLKVDKKLMRPACTTSKNT
jgi:hypothetical protein